ncbi:MAG: hypothetical protein WKF77_19940 [Planctomycetaceae bacterium]
MKVTARHSHAPAKAESYWFGFRATRRTPPCRQPTARPTADSPSDLLSRLDVPRGERHIPVVSGVRVVRVVGEPVVVGRQYIHTARRIVVGVPKHLLAGRCRQIPYLLLREYQIESGPQLPDYGPVRDEIVGYQSNPVDGADPGSGVDEEHCREWLTSDTRP